MLREILRMRIELKAGLKKCKKAQRKAEAQEKAAKAAASKARVAARIAAKAVVAADAGGGETAAERLRLRQRQHTATVAAARARAMAAEAEAEAAAAAAAAHQRTARVLDSRQLGLKLIANVTYGYTAAGFSGRMPCAELADAIVQTGRDTLRRCISLVQSEEAWQAEVIYGDTDSIFVRLPPGTSVHEAFRVGRQIAARTTAANPDPVKLKLEHVFMPCVLQVRPCALCAFQCVLMRE